MKIIAPMSKDDKTALTSKRFARAEFFATVDTETNEISIIPNPFGTEAHGVGTRVVNWCAEQGEVVIADQLGPNALQVVEATPNLKAYFSGGLTIDKIAAAYKEGKLNEYSGGPSSGGSHGKGSGRRR